MIDAAFIEGCAPTVAVETVQAIIQVESAGDPLALNANRNGEAVRLRADDLADAIRLARAEIAAGNTVDIGLMQINSANLPKLGYSVEQVFNPCTNLRAGAAILTAAYDGAAKTHGEGQDALRAALSAYNTGDYGRGFANGYVARYYAEHVAPAINYTADIYGADPTVYMRDPTQEQAPMHTIDTTTKPILTTDYDELLTPGVQVELTPDEAEALGLVEETALSEREAWESNSDPHAMERAGLRVIQTGDDEEAEAANDGR